MSQSARNPKIPRDGARSASRGTPARVTPLHPVSEAEEAFVVRARAIYPDRITGETAFDDLSWDVTGLRKRAHAQNNPNVYFTRHGSTDDPMLPRFAEVWKAACVLHLKGASNLVFRADAGRMLWEAVLERRAGDAERFFWSDLSVDDVRAAEQCMLRVWGEETVYRHCRSMQRMLDVLAGEGIVSPMRAPFVTPRPEDVEAMTLAGREVRDGRLPSFEAMEGVIDLYVRFAKTPEDQLATCVLLLALATGLRIGEILTLGWSPLVHKGTGRCREWGIRFGKEKSEGGKRIASVRWLTPTQAAFARSAVHRARRITRAAHLRAEVLDANPDTVPLPDVGPDEILTGNQVAALIGVSRDSVMRIAAGRLPRHSTKGPGSPCATYRAVDVSAYLQSLRPTTPFVIDLGGGKRRGYGDALFLVYRNQMHGARGGAERKEGRGVRPPNPLIVELLTGQDIELFLTGRREVAAESDPGAVLSRGRWMCTTITSAFERFGIRERNGRVVRMTSHGFRRWITTRASAAGVDDATLARLHNREHQGDLARYKFRSPEERAALLREALVSGRVRGAMASLYFALAEDERDVFLETQIQAVHITPLGYCIHDFKISPCPKALNCVKGCADYLHDTSNVEWRTNLVQLGNRTARALADARRQQELGDGDLAESWVADLEATEDGVRSILAAEPAEGTPWTRPFDGQGTRFEPTEE